MKQLSFIHHTFRTKIEHVIGLKSQETRQIDKVITNKIHWNHVIFPGSINEMYKKGKQTEIKPHIVTTHVYFSVELTLSGNSNTKIQH